MNILGMKMNKTSLKLLCRTSDFNNGVDTRSTSEEERLTVEQCCEEGHLTGLENYYNQVATFHKLIFQNYKNYFSKIQKGLTVGSML